MTSEPSCLGLTIAVGLAGIAGESKRWRLTASISGAERTDAAVAGVRTGQFFTGDRGEAETRRGRSPVVKEFII